MEGRLESKLKTEQTIRAILETAPAELTAYYYNISVDKEPTTCLEYVRKAKHALDTIAKPVGEITDMDLAKYMHQLEITTAPDGKPIQTSFAYRKMVHTALHSFFGYMQASGRIERNPMDCINRPKNTDDIKRQKITAKDFQSILEQVEAGAGTERAVQRQAGWKTRDMAIFALFMCTGMRETALTEINLSDIDWAANEIRVIDKRHKTHVYKMSAKLRATLTAWLKDREQMLAGAGIECDALFISNRRQRMHANSVAAIVKKYTAAALKHGISPHKIRAGFCTILYEQTGDIELVRDAVGHASVTTTQRYVVKDSTAKAKAASIMDNII